MQPDLARFLELIRRELGAGQVDVFDAGHEPPAVEGAAAIRCALGDGRVVVVACDDPAPEREAKQRRLEMLAATFDSVGEDEPKGPRARPPAARALHEELESLRSRAGAINAMVTDANSPILWSAARPYDVVPEALRAPSFAPEHDAPAEGEQAEDPAAVADASRRVLLAVRGVVDVSSLRRGRRTRHVERDGQAPFVVHSFANIYLLSLVFKEAFDELRAERAVLESLPRIERLVLALPPMDPSPQKGAGVVALRPGRPRRR